MARRNQTRLVSGVTPGSASDTVARFGGDEFLVIREIEEPDDAAAHAALLAVTRGSPGIYNVAEDDGLVAIDKAREDLGFDPALP